MVCSGCEEQQGLPEDIELELVADIVADPVVAPGVARQVEFPLFGNGAAGDGVGRGQGGAVGKQPGPDETTASSSSGYAPAAATAWPA